MNIKFPKEYRRLYQSGFAGLSYKTAIYIGEDAFFIHKFLNVEEINYILDEFYNLLGYDIVPIAETNYEDYICLYYNNKKNPSIICWNYELALEDPQEAILFLNNNIYDFEARLKK